MDITPNTQTCAGRYAVFESKRQTYLTRARDAAALTIPSLMPPEGHGAETVLPTPFQGIGARGVNNLASKLLLALLPPNSPFFRFMMDDQTLQKLQAVRAEVEKAFGSMERTIMTEIETSALRVDTFEGLKQLIVSGNALLFLPKEGGMRVFRLDRYVVSRDPMGNVLEIITKEDVHPSTLDPKIALAMALEQSATPDRTKAIHVYTRVYRDGKRWKTYQEINGQIVPGSDGSYPLDKTPYLPLRFTKIDGEDYGRGYIEEYIGELRSLEALTKAIVEGSAAASRVLFLVNPNGTTSQKTLAESPNGAIRTGNAEDVSVVQTEKYADFRVAFETIGRIEQRLSFAFLLNTAIQRPGERVTAEEIRYMAGELEDALGGVYSILSQELQLPLVNRLIYQLERAGKLPTLPRGMVRPSITTGMEALGRGQDLTKLNMLLQNLAPLGPEVIAQYLSVGDYITRVATSLGMDTNGLVRSEQEVQAAQAQAQNQMAMQGMVEKLGPKAIDMVRDQVKPSGKAA